MIVQVVTQMQQTPLESQEKSRSAKHADIVDSEELQLKDECNRKWVGSWKKAVK